MIGPFKNEFYFLSNFYMGKPIKYDGFSYPTAEHAFQANKTKDKLEKEYIASALTPGEAKRRGRITQLRSDWETVKNKIMFEIVKEKFLQDTSLQEKLLNTKEEEIVEVNVWGDRYWGADKNGRGRNMLGKILMQVRNELREMRNKNGNRK